MAIHALVPYIRSGGVELLKVVELNAKIHAGRYNSIIAAEVEAIKNHKSSV